MKERKIGEIFERNGEWYQCVEHKGCHSCAFALSHGIGIRCCFNGDPHCTYRSDGKPVIFKKLEKVGKSYIIGNKLIQQYKIYPTTYHINVYGWYYHNLDVKSWTIDIEIKQNKEDMEEYRMHDAREDIPEFDKVVDECLFGEDKLNLKPFDLEAAKAGKPVCTRDGRNARIICFDRKFYHDGYNYPIVAMVNDNDNELVHAYTQGGLLVGNMERDLDLMMLPEKKEGWVNIYRSQIYDTLERAKEAYKRTYNDDNYLQTIKIEWEE